MYERKFAVAPPALSFLPAQSTNSYLIRTRAARPPPRRQLGHPMHTLALWGALAVLWLQLVSGRREPHR